MADQDPPAFDPAELFEDDPEAGDNFAKSIEDFFRAPVEKAAAHPTPAPELVPPEAGTRTAGTDRGGITEEEWRASPEYDEFRREVIARHLRQKAEQSAPAAEFRPAGPSDAEGRAREAAQAEERRRELLEKYQAAKAATIARRKAEVVRTPPPPPRPSVAGLPPLPSLPPLKNLPNKPLTPLPPLRPLPPLPPLKEDGNA